MTAPSALLDTKKPPRLQRDGFTPTTWKGSKMPYNLTSDDLEVEIGELIEQYAELSSHPSFGLVRTFKSRPAAEVEAAIHVDSRFTGEHVETFAKVSGGVGYVLAVRGVDLFDALRNLRNAFLAAAPSFETAKEA